MIIGLIPARSGSKGIPDKNIKPLGGYPLLAWSIVASKLAGLDRTIVSTDSREYADIATHYGAEALIRPQEISLDDSPDIGYVRHLLHIFPCEYCVILRPTTPLREPVLIETAISTLKTAVDCSSLRTVSAVRDTTFHYYTNGYVDVLDPLWVEDDHLYGQTPLLIESPTVGEIDKPEDFDYIQWRLERYGSPIYEYLRRTYPL